ncbi:MULTISPECIES: hypothetical protein [unclassified Clostridium]|uniref:hypothetical protein n=1 Tax=unclassified Clostridium TaxID=2614128 RepID=UPI00023AFA0A|nr:MULTISPECIES: hypothetical protein [unclassified Clostridium]EHJ00019.1 hypothetical protein CDLVIII_3458 [Clostridium sp. DL-VIII]OOM80701.1 hypothetical protein CLOBL_07340 [Clostridium sp. BL-8]
MSNVNKGHTTNKMNDNYIDYQGGYISYDPNALTEHYTVKGFEGKIKKPQVSKSRWC